MGHIKEPNGVDFTVVPQTKPDPETDRLVSEFIRKRKLENPKEWAKIEAKAKEIIRKYKASRGLMEATEVSENIKEPKGVDFTVVTQAKSDEKTDRMVSDFIQSYKPKNENNK